MCAQAPVRPGAYVPECVRIMFGNSIHTSKKTDKNQENIFLAICGKKFAGMKKPVLSLRLFGKGAGSKNTK